METQYTIIPKTFLNAWFRWGPVCALVGVLAARAHRHMLTSGCKMAADGRLYFPWNFWHVYRLFLPSTDIMIRKKKSWEPTCTVLLALLFTAVTSELVVNVKNKGGDVQVESIDADTAADTVAMHFVKIDGTHVSQFIDFRSVRNTNKNILIFFFFKHLFASYMFSTCPNTDLPLSFSWTFTRFCRNRYAGCCWVYPHALNEWL